MALSAEKAKAELIGQLERLMANYRHAEPAGEISLLRLEVAMTIDALKNGQDKIGPVLEEEFWGSGFGTQYTERNQVNWAERVPFWCKILEMTDATSVLDVGCNCAWNQRAIREIDPKVTTWGVDVNPGALNSAKAAGLSVAHRSASDLRDFGNFDLVVTSGVLIHMPTDKLEGVMKEIIRASRQYVLAIEYPSKTEHEDSVPYRGYYLWRRPFGFLYQRLGLKLVASGETTPGFKECAWWLLEKPV